MRTVGPTLAAALSAAVLLSGCGGSPEPRPLPDPTKNTSPSASASAAPTAPVMPEAAKAKTRVGAGAFVEHYIQLVNYAGTSGRTTPLRVLSLRSCVKCEALADGVDEIYSSGGRITGGGWAVVRIRHYGFDRGHYFLDAIIDSAPQEMVAKAGAPVQKFPGASNRLRAFVLERAAGAWKVSELDPAA